jgi:hypothetical protein
MSTEMPSDINIPSEEPGVSNNKFAVTWDKEIDSNQDPWVTTNQQDSQASQEAEGASPTTSTITAGTSQRGRARTMSRKMANSVSQQDFYGNANMHYMALQSLMGETDEDLFHNNDTQLQDAIKELQGLGLNIKDQGHPADYVGVNISKLWDGSYKVTQRALIDSIINDIGSTTPSPSLFQPRYLSNCMLSRMTLHSSWISTTDLLLASSTT